MFREDYWHVLRDYLPNVDKDFPFEKFGTGDRLILMRVVQERGDHFIRNGMSSKLCSAIFVVDVMDTMKRQYGFKPDEDIFRTH